MTKDKIKSYNFGIIAEFIAIIFLKLKGYKILKRRYKTYLGEVDIIAVKNKFLVAIEVKARKSKNDINLEEILSNQQKSRIKRAMLFFVAGNFKKYYHHSLRFDLIIIKPYGFPRHLIGFWE